MVCGNPHKLSVFLAFEEPFADTSLLERNKLFFFDPKNQQSNELCPSELS